MSKNDDPITHLNLRFYKKTKEEKQSETKDLKEYFKENISQSKKIKNKP